MRIKLNQIGDSSQASVSVDSVEEPTSNVKLRLIAIRESSKKLMAKYEEESKNAFETKYVLGSKIGEGMHSSVYKCFLKSDIKKFSPFAVKISRDDDEEKKIAHRNEFEISKKFNHLNIINSKEFYENDVTGEIHMVMQYFEGLEILDHIGQQPNDFYTDTQAKCIFEQILSGIDYLHS